MATAREIMTPDAVCVRSSETALDAAKLMARNEIGAVPICGEDGRLKGMLTDRDIVVRVIAEGKEARAVHASELAQGDVITIHADADAAEILRTMKEHQVRRLPVIDNHQLVGVVAQADVARALGHPEVGDLLDALSR
jgi:CBS domain-containing protein